MRTCILKQALLGFTLLILTVWWPPYAHAEFEEYKGTQIHAMYLCPPSAVEELKKIGEARAKHGPKASNPLFIYLMNEGDCDWIQISHNVTVAFNKIIKSWPIDKSTQTAFLVETKGANNQLSYGLWTKTALEKELKAHVKGQTI